MYRPTLSVLALALFAAHSRGDVHVEVAGFVNISSFGTGQFATVNNGDPAIVSFDLITPGQVVTPGQFTRYDILPGSFDLDINGPTGLTYLAGSPATVKILNDNLSIGGMDRFELNLPTLSGGHTLACNYTGTAGFLASDDLTQSAGSRMLFSFSVGDESFRISHPTTIGLIDVSMTTFTVTVVGTQQYPDSCSGDGGNQMGCTNCPCANNALPGTVGGCLNSAGTSTRLSGTGNSSVTLPAGSTSDLRFGLTGAPANAFCILNSGDAIAPGNMANPCFGMDSGGQAIAFDGLRCAITNTRRHGGRSANASGEVGTSVSPWGGEGGPSVGIANAGAGFVPGQTRFFQVIHRDDALLGCMRGLNTSQAVEVTFIP